MLTYICQHIYKCQYNEVNIYKDYYCIMLCILTLIYVDVNIIKAIMNSMKDNIVLNFDH